MAASRRRQTLAFDSGHLNERGTDVALYDYAHFAEELLGHRSLILVPAEADLSALDRFRQRFPVYLYRSRADLEELLEPVDLYYTQVYGDRPSSMPPKPPSGRRGVHCVFTADQPYGEIYATISAWLSQERGLRSSGAAAIPVVPYMVHLPQLGEDVREALGIPPSAVVLGRHGGAGTFNIPWVRDVVGQAVQRREDLHFLFLNTERFMEHPRVHWLGPTNDLEEKRIFINTCDAMLHGRAEGETFGLAVAEFSICNKPVFTWDGSYDKSHIQVLGDKGIYYRGPQDLLGKLLSWRPCPDRDWDAFSARFSPPSVMRQFSRVFLGQEPSVGDPEKARGHSAHSV